MSSKADYLQKYLSGGQNLPGVGQTDEGSKKKKKKKKKKDKANVIGNRVNIIDEDAFQFGSSTSKPVDANKEKADAEKREKKKRALKQSQMVELSDSEEEDRKYSTLEEQPQIAGYVDERPDVVIMKEKFVQNTFISIDDDVKKEEKDKETGGKDNEVERSRKRLLEQVQVKEEPRSDEEEAASPPRRRRRHDTDEESGSPSPPRRRHDTSESGGESPPRRRHDSDASPPRRRHDSDASPPRRRQRHDSDASPPRRRQDDSDASPPRRRRQQSDSDPSPPRRHVKPDPDSDPSPPRRHVKPDPDSDASPPRRHLATKTLDGKKAGLQNARDLKGELESLRQRERDVFKDLSTDVSGRGAETKVRGRLKAKAEEEREKKEKNEITEEVKKKYSRWSKGVKQSEAIQQRIAEDLAEMDKPLTRTADDVDLDAHLKNIERAEDPMLKYIQKKKEKKHVGPKYPKYQGAWPQNRYHIPPGYRWDGVDRSNGFEKRLALKASERTATNSEAYKWSTEDM